MQLKKKRIVFMVYNDAMSMRAIESRNVSMYVFCMHIVSMYFAYAHANSNSNSNANTSDTIGMHTRKF